MFLSKRLRVLFLLGNLLSVGMASAYYEVKAPTPEAQAIVDGIVTVLNMMAWHKLPLGGIQYELVRAGFMKDPYEKSAFRKVVDASLCAPRELLNAIQNEVRNGSITPEEAMQKVGDVIKGIASGMVNFVIPYAPKFAAFGLGVYASKLGIDVLKSYIMMLINQPKLIRQILQPRQITKSFKDLHYTQATKNDITYVIDMAKYVANNSSRAEFENVMLWGAPGTGKTAIIEIIAKEAGMTLYKLSGGDLAKLQGKDLEQIDRMLDNARKNRGMIFKRPVLIFIDEMEELFGSRARANLSENARNVLSKLLVEFDRPSNQILLIGATNRPEDLDEAMHRRMPLQIQVDLPDREGRKAIFELYVRKLFMQDKHYSAHEREQIQRVFNDAMLEQLTDRIGRVAPAEVEDLMNRIKNRSGIYNKGVPTTEIIEYVLVHKCKQLQARQEGFVRDSVRAAAAVA